MSTGMKHQISPSFVRPIRRVGTAACAALICAAFQVGCDPGDQCDPKAGDFPEGVDPCDPATYPGASDAAADTGSADTSGPDTGETDAADQDVTGAPYPAANTGVREGQTAPNLTLPTLDGGEFSFEDDVFRDDTVKLLLVSTAAGWCPGCREEQPTLVALYDEHREDGLMVILPIFEDNNADPVTESFAESWRQQYGLPFPVLIDVFNDFATFYEPTLAPLNMFIDGTTMEIVNITIGVLDEATSASVISDRL